MRIDEFEGTWLNSNIPDLSPELPAFYERELIGESGKSDDVARIVSFIGLCIGGEKFQALYRDGAFGGAANTIVTPLVAAKACFETCRENTPEIDEIIPLTHLDIPDDVELAETDLFPVIIGGHDHHRVHEQHGARKCHLVKAGMDATHAAIIDIFWTDKPDAQPRVEVVFKSVADYEPDEEACALVELVSEPVRELETAVLYELRPGEKLSSVDVRTCPNTMAVKLATAVRECLNCEAAVVNSGCVRGNQAYSSTVSYADLKKECPFPSAVVVTQMPFEVFREAVKFSRKDWPNEVASSLQVDVGVSVDEDLLPITIQCKKPEDDRLYAVACDTYFLKKNPVLREYCKQYPERIPPQDVGRPLLPILVEYFCGLMWRRLYKSIANTPVTGCDPVERADSNLEKEEIAHVFRCLDSDGDGTIDAEELADGVRQHIGDKLSSNIIVAQMIALVDLNGDGVISRMSLQNASNRFAARPSDCGRTIPCRSETKLADRSHTTSGPLFTIHEPEDAENPQTCVTTIRKQTTAKFLKSEA
jgi:hypothetical protein